MAATTKTQRLNRKTSEELLIWEIPPKLKLDFKAACARRRITMRDAIINTMKAMVRADRESTEKK